MKTIALAVLLCLPMAAQSRKQLWISLAAFGAAEAVDAASSWHKPEMNPLVASDGRFGAKGIGIKIGLTAGLGFLEWKGARGRKLERFATVVNYVGAGVELGAAGRRW